MYCSCLSRHSAVSRSACSLGTSSHRAAADAKSNSVPYASNTHCTNAAGRRGRAHLLAARDLKKRYTPLTTSEPTPIPTPNSTIELMWSRMTGTLPR